MGIGHFVILVTVWLRFYADTIDITQENWQKLIDMQHMLTGIDNIVLADRVCAVCLIIIIIIINVKINVALSEDASRTRPLYYKFFPKSCFEIYTNCMLRLR